MKDGKLRILIVDDEEAIRHFLKASLRAYQHTIFEAGSGQEALDLTSQAKLDLIILDLGLPDMDGVEVIREVRQWNNLPIIVLSVRNREQDKIAALDEGADDYLTKPFGVGELIARIRGVMRQAGGLVVGGTLRLGALFMDVARREVHIGTVMVSLTPTEFDILHILMQEAGKVLTHHQIIDRVWGAHQGDESRLLRVNISNLRKKIEPDPNQPVYIKTELGVGYRVVDPWE